MSKVSGNKALASGVWFTVSNFIMKTIGFLTTPIFTRLMTKTEYGDFNNFQTWLMILMYITSLNLEGSLIRASQEFKDDIDRYSFSMVALSALSTSAWWIIANVFYNPISSLLDVNRLYLNAMFVYLLFYPAVNIFQFTERFKFKYKWTVISTMCISIGASLLSVVFVVLLDDKLFGRTIGYVIPSIIVGTIVVLFYIKRAKNIYIKYWKYALPITLPFIPHLLSMYLLTNMDKVMIKKICSSEDLAMYSLAYIVGTLITILGYSINNAYSPWLAEKLNAKEYIAIKKLSLPYVAIVSYLAVGAVLITPELLLIMGGNSYAEAKYVMPPVAAGCILQFVYCMYVNIEQYEKKTVPMAFASLIAALTNFALNYLFIPKYGYIAAAYTTYVGYLVLLLLHMFIVKKLKMAFVYKNIPILIVAVITSLIVISVTFLFNHNIVRYAIIVVYAIVTLALLYKNRKGIISFVRRKEV